MKPAKLGHLGGLRIEAEPSAWLALALIWVGAALVYVLWIGISARDAILYGLAAALLHTGVTLAHHFGHAVAANRVGHPMAGVRFRFGIATSLYPTDEPQLSGRTHIRRAVGGPIGSVLLALVVGAAALALRSTGNDLWTLGLFAALDSLIVFGLGVLVPLGFTDGSTLLYWWGRK